MLIKLRAIFYFHRRLFLPSIAIAMAFGLWSMVETNSFNFQALGLAYFFMVHLLHFFIYELSRKNEYYFYYNLGLSRLRLWLSTSVIALFFLIFFSLL